MSISQDDEMINVQIYVPDFQIQKCMQVNLDETVWDVKQKVLTALPQDQPELFNYGLFLPPCNGRAGKFLLEERPFRDYPFQDCVPYLELKYKKRVYKMLKIDEKLLKQLHSKGSLKKFMEYVVHQQKEKIEKLLHQGLDPNFHDQRGETPLTVAASLPDSRTVMMTLVAGGAHLDYRNMEGQTALHKAVFCDTHANVKTLLELGASPNCKDPLGLTPLYYCMLQANTSADTAEMLLRDFAQLGTTDMHGNQEIHQACKNGLTKHLEHLLYYGADMNAQNINGNTPLHVCSVNNRDTCARVLLFRGADPNVCNNQNQNPYHVAVIVGHPAVAEVLRTHDPSQTVPYRGAPRYNSKRRMSRSTSVSNYAASSLSRTRSISQSSLASVGSSLVNGTSPYQQTGRGRASPMVVNGGMHPSHYQSTSLVHPNGHSMRKSVTMSEGFTEHSHYNGTLTRRDSNASSGTHTPSFHQIGSDVNIPRILVIPRGPKGFGFILRGAKKMEPGVQFEPSAAVPALQFFEGVDMNGMSMKAGLKPGDFLLEINSVDVRCANHDRVVQLIQMSGDTISLKVITIDPDISTSAQQRGPQPPAATGNVHFGTMPSRRPQQRARSLVPPLPPQRHPSTSLSTARGRQYTQTLNRFDDGQVYANTNGQQGPQNSNDSMVQLMPAKSMDHLPQNAYRVAQNGQGDPKVASIRSRSQSRRISASELEQLMARQGSVDQDEAISPMAPPHSASTPYTNGHRKYTSVADMKRKKQQHSTQSQQQIYRQAPQPPTPQSGGGLPRSYGAPVAVVHDESMTPMKSFTSSPNLQRQQFDFTDHPEPPRGLQRRPSTCSQTSSEPRSPRALRPKTPPPPPPVVAGRPPKPPTSSTSAPPVAPPQMAGVAPPPAPPPPPPPDMLTMDVRPGDKKKADCRGVTADALKKVKLNKTVIHRDASAPIIHSSSSLASTSSSSNHSTASTSAGGGAITPAALSAVKLKKSTHAPPPMHHSPSAPVMPQQSSSDQTGSRQGPVSDFDSDLRQALAKRRNVISNNKSNSQQQTKTALVPSNNPNPNVVFTTMVDEQNTPTAPNNISPNSNASSHKSTGSAKNANSRSGLSLKESVRQSVASKSANGKVNNRSPPPPVTNGFNKKDSGYTSSRTSLEPSECGDEVMGTTVLANVAESESGDERDEDGVPPSPDFPPPPPPELLQASMNVSDGSADNRNRVSMLSQQLEDSFGGQPPPSLPQKPRGQSLTSMGAPSSRQQQQSNVTMIRVNSRENDAMSITSTLSTLSGCSADSGQVMSMSHNSRLSQQRSALPPHMPPPDYDADSGTGDSDAEKDDDDDRTPQISRMDLTEHPTPSGNNMFSDKQLPQWTVGDVCDWLESLQFCADYKSTFAKAKVDGKILMQAKADRKFMTEMGVTKIAHRKAIETSLKRYMPVTTR